MTITIGVDIGGSRATAVAFDDQGATLRQAEVGARPSGARQVLASTLAVIDLLHVDEIAAVGVGVPGQVDCLTGEVRMAVNLGIGDEAFPLAREIETVLGCPVTVENDVRAAALGIYESFRRRGQAPESLALVSIGTGIAAGVVVNGVIVRGWHGMAGEIGHVVVDPDGPRCRCGQRGCLEVIAAGPALARAWPQGEAGAAGSALFSAAAAGDPAAGKVASRIAGHLTTALTWLAATHDTELIVLGGGVAGAGEPLLQAIREEIVRRAAASELAARRLRPEQVTLVGPDDIPGPRGASVLARGRLLHLRDSPARTKASNDK
ncbi:MAG TPA: ROK family protein [Acidimicrobiia bacterium]|nr:ROK family protein [Acidimicrobiia bacterium]